MLAFAAIEKGSVGVSGSTGAMLRRCLQDLSAVIEARAQRRHVCDAQSSASNMPLRQLTLR